MLQMQLDTRAWATSLVAILSLVGLSAEAPAQVAQVPIPAGQGKLTPAAPILGDVFGSALAVDGSFLVTGGVGAAWVFEDIGGIWVQQERLTAPNASLNFGTSVAISGNRILVSDTGDDNVPVTARVFVFERELGVWNIAATLPDSGGKSAFDAFGSSLAMHGDTVIVGSKHVGGDFGAAYIYNFDGVNWNEQAALLAPTPRSGAVFGSSVAIFADRVAIGAPGDPLEQVVICMRNGSNWTPTRTFSEGDVAGGQSGTGFGSAVALGPNTCIVGLPSDSTMGPSAGSIAIFEDGGMGLEFMENCTADDVAPNDQFGVNIALEGNRILIGAPNDGMGGSAYLFTRDPSGLLEEAKFTAADGQLGDKFGNSVGLSGSTVAFGSPFNAEGGAWVGAVYTLTQISVPSMSRTVCFGDGGDQAGCTNCPCNNNAPAGTLGGCLNSVGTSAQLSIMGQASLIEDSLRLEVARAHPLNFGILFSGSELLPTSGMNPCGSGAGVTSLAFDGLRCAGAGIRRHGVRTADANGDIGVSNAGWGLADEPAGGLVAQGGFAVGETRYFQVAYRENSELGCNTGLGTTNAAVTVVAP